MDLINKNSGNIIVDGKQITRKNIDIKEEIGYLPSEIYLYEDLTVEKMFKYSANFYKKDCSRKTSELVKKLDLDIKKKIDELSLGNLKKVGIVLALMHDPKILILDEATSGLDPLMQEQFYEIIRAEKKVGKTIFFSSHNLSEIRKLCDKVAVIKEGKIIKVGDVEELSDREWVTVIIHSSDADKIKKETNGIISQEEKENYIKFIYQNDINILIKELSKYNIEKLLIEEPSLEDVFMHYYK